MVNSSGMIKLALNAIHAPTTFVGIVASRLTGEGAAHGPVALISANDGAKDAGIRSIFLGDIPW
ncbi:hypothetical protein [Ciceribacter sp. T2.26MG-112.2]|uniref:hypothetical protein n=1 Tax=Ciceribacter sp. T2.26MG-112.2 TaxID=3137154 RepID=UPI0012B6988B|nr:hypothetical protein [Ciceribacter naphthalenivorans]